MVFPCAVRLRGTGKRRLFHFQRVVKSPRMGENPARCAKGTVRRKCVSAPAFRTARRNAPQKTAERPAPRDTSSALRLCPPRRASPGPANAETFRPQGSVSFTTHLPAPQTREALAFKGFASIAAHPRPRKRGKLSPSKALPPSLRIPGPADVGAFHMFVFHSPENWPVRRFTSAFYGSFFLFPEKARFSKDACGRPST